MNSAPTSTFLTRLAKDTAGNTLVIMAVAFFPLIGLIGGGVDMTRIYITSARLQQACDAGALSGRKAMGSGAWSTGTGGSRDQANTMFAANFSSGDYGTSGMTRTFTESDGTVTGEVSAKVPMTLMAIFDQKARTVSVTCTAKMEIPNTDVMFVLDLTASMNCAVTDSSCEYQATPATNARVVGLRKAVKCFYEALLKVNTPEVCKTKTQPDGTVVPDDPTAASYSGTAQIRLGFVPYAVNVNVGKLLPNTYLADTWPYQSRVARTGNTVQTWTTEGADSAADMSAGTWTSAPNPDSASNYTNWQDLSYGTGDTSIVINSVSYTKRQNLSKTNCGNLNALLPSQTIVTYVNGTAGTAGTPYTNGTPAAPGYPATTQTIPYRQDRNNPSTGYKFLYDGSASGVNKCRMQSGTRTFTSQRNGSATRSVVWKAYEEFVDWSYNERDMPVAGLKAGVSSWNTTVTIPRLATATVPNLYRSGQSTSSNIVIPADRDATWDGCIEELPTHRSDADPSNDYNPVPSDAKDLKIDHIPDPTDSATQWGPLLNPGSSTDSSKWVYFGRYTGTTLTSRTTAERIASSNLDQNLANGIYGGYYCPKPARRLRSYTTADTADPVTLETGFVSYINSLDSTGIGTYHDIGLLWGARLLSPTGIFGASNAATPNGGAIERHMIFMTDGDSRAFVNNLYAYGAPWYDREQTPSATAPTDASLTAQIKPRTEALCTAIKNMNIKLWVISYGGGANATTEAMLEACASPGQYYSAANDTLLISKFQQIASEIADLRLTR